MNVLPQSGLEPQRAAQVRNAHGYDVPVTAFVRSVVRIEA